VEEFGEDKDRLPLFKEPTFFAEDLPMVPFAPMVPLLPVVPVVLPAPLFPLVPMVPLALDTGFAILGPLVLFVAEDWGFLVKVVVFCLAVEP